MVLSIIQAARDYITGNPVLFVILAFLLIRLVGITDPPLEMGHNWRQSTGLMVARNFHETSPNILYPRVDEYGDRSGIIGMEFPSLNYAHFLISKVWGYEHWYGRLLNLVLTSIGVWYFARILGMFFNRRMVLYSTTILLASIWFGFSRKMMPDTWCIAWMLIACYYGLQYFMTSQDHRKRLRYLGIFFLLSTLGMLSKISAAVYLGLFIPIVWNAGVFSKKSLGWITVGLLSIAIVSYWYFVWNPHLASTYETWYNSGQSPAIGLKTLIEHPTQTLRNFYFLAFNGYVLFAFSLAGLFLLFKKRRSTVIWPLAGITLMFGGYMIISGHFFYNHSYYIIPFVPVLAILAGFAISQIRSPKIAITLLLIGVGESIANQQHDFRINDSELYKLELQRLVNHVSEPGTLICINGNGNPQQLYLSHHKGWVVTNQQIQDLNFLDSLQTLGCRLVVVDTRDENITLPLDPLLVHSHYRLYSFPKTPRAYSDFK